MSCPKDNINIFGTIFADTMMVMRKIYPNDRKYGLNHFLQKLNLDLKHDVSYNYIKKYYELSEHSNDYVENI
jgi:DNA polymerase III alpha subunit (gram-positive type)